MPDLCLACGNSGYLDVYAPDQCVALPCPGCANGTLQPQYEDDNADGWLDGVPVAKAYWQLGPHSEPPSILVVHRFAKGRTAKAARYVCKPLGADGSMRTMSYHLSIGWEGDAITVQQHARLDRIAWNAGDKYANARSISLELPAAPDADPHGPYMPEEIDALVELVASLALVVPTLRVAVAHSAIVPRRRKDPGKRFPWPELRALGLATAETPEEWAAWRRGR